MKTVFLNANVFIKNRFVKTDILVSDRVVSSFSPFKHPSDAVFFDLDNDFIFPGFVDVHVHLREPGFFYKEDIASGTMAAAHGGYSTVCSMPNLNPAPDSRETLSVQLKAIEEKANVHVYPYGTITMGEKGECLSEMEETADDVIAFSDDGRGVQDDNMMRRAMLKAKELNKIIAAHCEDNSLLNGGYIHDGEYAWKHGHKGIPSACEWKQIERDLRLVRETGCKYHVCHISAKESVELIRRAKAEQLDVTCETAPHYLLLDEHDLQEDGCWKMNPPLRGTQDRLALIEGIQDGTIDMIATDHAPHAAEEKAGGLKDSVMGIVGLETAFPLLYTGLVQKHIISLEKLIELMSVNPAKRFGIKNGIEIGNTADFAVFDLNGGYKIDPDTFFSKGKSTPFKNRDVFGRCKMTVVDGRIIWKDNSIEKSF